MKTNVTKGLGLGFCLAVAVASCKEDPLMLYADGDTGVETNNVYFSLKRYSDVGTSYKLQFPVGDSLYVESWSVITRPRDSIIKQYALERPVGGIGWAAVPVSLMGYPADYERPIAYAIEPSTAVEGVHFDVYKAAIPAGATVGAIMLKIYQPAIVDTAYTVNFRLLDNEHFRTRYEYIQRSSTDTSRLDMRTFKLRMSDQLEVPDLWSSMRSAFGNFSAKKLRLLAEVAGADLKEFYQPSPSLPLIFSWAGILTDYLQNMKDKGTPVMEADGVTPMTTPGLK